MSQSAPYQAGFVPPAPAPIVGPDQYMLPSYPQQQAMIPSFLTEEANNSIESLETSSMSAMSGIIKFNIFFKKIYFKYYLFF